MKPTFALDLTRDAIALLHRTPKGWMSIGEVAFDASDMAEALDYLRKTALGLSPLGMTCKIILPASQILYTEVEAPGPSRNDKRRQIAEALEGRTPYPVEDLVFDWSGKGATVKVAVIARETLAEAEDFAVAHRLNPVSFVAIPEHGAFVGEPWFGPTVAADTLLAPGEAVDRDREPVTILLRDLPQPELAADPVSVPASTPDSPPAAMDVAAPPGAVADEDAPLPGLEEALNAPLAGEVTPAAQDAAHLGPLPEARSEGLPDTATDPQSDDPILPESAGLAEAVQVLPPAGPLPFAADASPAAVEPHVEEAPFAHVTDTTAFPDDDDMARPNGGPQAIVPPLDDDIPPAPPSAALAAFASRRSATGSAPGPAAGASQSSTGAASTDLARSRLAGPPVPRPVVPPKSGSAGLVTAPSIPGTRPKSRVKPGAGDLAASTATGPSAMKSPARPGGTFGTAAPPRNRSGVVFMVLVALLLLFLALIAGWSSFFLSRNGQTEVETGALQADDPDVPAIDDEKLADLQDPDGMTDPLPEAESALTGDAAALATETLPVNIGGDEALAESAVAGGITEEAVAPTDELVGAEALVGTETLATNDALPTAEPLPTDAEPGEAATPGADAVAPPETEPAPATAVTTELAAAQAPVEDQDEIFLSAMDAPPPALDALALPVPETVADAAPDAPMPPPAFGTVYQFDANGLLKPTPEGILSPAGVMLIAGKPPRLPPSRSDVASAAALAAAPAA
ncbi:MAG: hypothetical protein NTW20_17600, partial [Rhodobacterales bacterium]|nr:hypothetical protein [Rhodobacterales bacterium]